MVEDVGLNESTVYIFILWHYWKILDLQLLLSIKANLRNTMDTWKINSANKSYPNESESRECWQIGMCKPQLTSTHCEKNSIFWNVKPNKIFGSNMNCTTFQIERIWVQPMKVLDTQQGVGPQGSGEGKLCQLYNFILTEGKEWREGQRRGRLLPLKTGTWGHTSPQINGTSDRKKTSWNMSTEVINGALAFQSFPQTNVFTMDSCKNLQTQ